MEQTRRSSAGTRVLLTLMLLGASLTLGFAQIQYSIKLQPNGKTYVVSLKSATTQTGSNQYTSSAQVTVVVPTGSTFSVSNLQNIATGTIWSNNTTVRTPSQSPRFDYFIFGLAPNAPQIPFTAGQETPLFSFDNTGTCPGRIELWAANDPFQPNPPSQPINVGNELTAFGFGYNNAWTGNYNLGSADCSAAPGIAILTPANNTTTTTANVPVSGTASVGSTVVLTAPGPVTLCTSTVSATGSWSCLVSLTAGPQTLSAVATSANGVPTSPATTNITAIAPPTVAITSPRNVTVTTTPTISGTATPNSTVVLTGAGNAVLCTTTASAGGSYSCLVSIAAGAASVTAVSTNSGGTSGPAVTSFTVVGAPTVAILSPITGSTATTSPTLSGTATPGSTVVLTGPVGTTLCTAIASPSGLFACGVSVSPGPISVTAVATTPAGVSTPSVVSFTAVAPPAPTPDLTLSIGQPSPNLIVNQVSSLPVSVSNIGSAATTGPVTVTLSLPASLTAPASFSSNGFGCTTAGTSVSCSYAGPIGSGTSTSFSVPITPLAAAVGTTPTISGVVATTNEPITGNNTATTTVTVPVGSDCQAKAPTLTKS